MCEESVPFLEKVISEYHEELRRIGECFDGGCNPQKKKGKLGGPACTKCERWITKLKAQGFRSLSRGPVDFKRCQKYDGAWEMAKMYMPRQPKNQPFRFKAKDFDTASLLQLMGQCRRFHDEVENDGYEEVLFS